MGTWNPAKGALPSWLTKAAELRMTQIAYGHGTWLGKPSSRGSRPVEEDVILDNYDNPDTLFDAVDSPAGIELAYHEGEIAEALDALSPAQRRYVVARFWLGLDPASRTPEMQRLCALVPEMRRGSSLWLGTTGQRGARQRLADALAHLAPAA
jgi:hypothetical protein